MIKRQIVLVLLFFFLWSLFPILAQENIQILGKVWNPGFFEVATSIAGNEEYIYICDTNNAQVQAFDKTFRPFFHFGGYGTQDGQFISLQGVQASGEKLFVSSIQNYQDNKGKIQVFSQTGLYEHTFEIPTIRSDFLRTSPIVNSNVYAITRTTLCTFHENGSLVSEYDAIDNLSFLDLKDIDVFDQNIFLVDSQRRGFMVANLDLTSVSIFGEELISIPIAIETFNNSIFIADAKGNIFVFSPKGKHLSTIPYQENVLINSIYHAQQDILYATTTHPHSILKINIPTMEVSIIEMKPASPLELHWPSTICASQKELLYTNDDVTNSIKCIQGNSNEFVSEVGLLKEGSSDGYVNPEDLCSGQSEILYVIDQDHTNCLYEISNTTTTLLYKGVSSSYFTHLAYHDPYIYILDQYNQCIHQISQSGKLEETFSFQESMQTILCFYLSNNTLYALNNKGIVYVLEIPSGQTNRIFQLKPFSTSSAKMYCLPLEDRFLVVNRNDCCIDIYNNQNGVLFMKYGGIGGPNTFIQDSNSQVNLWYESGFFLFPEKIIAQSDRIFIADAGNHRIQSIPLHHFLQTVIQLTINTYQATINGTSTKMDAAPYISKGRTMVPLRFISEAFRAEVQWDSIKHEISIQDRDTMIVLTIGSTNMKVNGQDIRLDVPPEIRTSRTFVPIRAISEALKAVVEWNAANQTVTIRRM
jgi:WD40 repeat protein